MLLSIDRVLQLLAEDKSVSKIAELAKCAPNSVIEVIEEARRIIYKYEKPKAKKKIIIKNKEQDIPDNNDNKDLNQIFEGSELSAVPVESSLTIYTDGASKGNPGPSGIGIVILDKEGRQVGKVSLNIGNATNNFAEYTAVIRALKIAIYFKTKILKIRTDSELIVKQIMGDYKVQNDNIMKLYSQVMDLKSKINNCKIEHVTRNLNDKADHLAKIASESII